LSTRSAAGATAQQEVEVAPGTTRAVQVPVAPGSASLITVERVAGGAAWYAAVVQSGLLGERPIIAAATGDDPSTKVRLPPAHPDPHTLAGVSG
jgi:hypothetical protein